MGPVKTHGKPPYFLAVLHGGPGAPGSAAGLAAGLAEHCGILEPWQSECSVAGQVTESTAQLRGFAAGPAVLIGHSWGAWLALWTAVARPELVSKLILVGSGPLQEKYVSEIERRRLANLTEAEGIRYRAVLQALEHGGEGSSRDALLRELGELSGKSDVYCPSPEPEIMPDEKFDGELFQAVWPEAAARRRSGDLLKSFLELRCPLTVIHGEHDPHPAAGVIEPLEQLGLPFNAYLLKRCGHTPWRELYARDRFFELLLHEIGV